MLTAGLYCARKVKVAGVLSTLDWLSQSKLSWDGITHVDIMYRWRKNIKPAQIMVKIRR